MKFNIKHLIAITFFLFFLNTFYAMAGGPPPPPPGGGGPPCFPPPCIPIDGGISFLVAAGIAIGAKKVHDSRKKS